MRHTPYVALTDYYSSDYFSISEHHRALNMRYIGITLMLRVMPVAAMIGKFI